jgi:DNA polymerase-3 subunit chi
MTISKLTQIVFIRVSDNIAKIQRLCSVVHDHFIKKDKILIVVPSNEAAIYLDKLLWKLPEESFTPHVLANVPTKEQVAITTATTNINQASVIINLLNSIHPNPGAVEVIYELLDLTSKEKEEASRQKQSAYRNAGHDVQEC